MNLSKLNDWLQLFAALGVIAGLLLVATEIRQNAAFTRVQLNSDEQSAMDELARSMQQEPLARALAKSYDVPRELAKFERIILDGYYREIFQKAFREWLFIQRGVYTDELDVYAAIFTRDVLSSEFGRAWWISYKEGTVPSDLVARIDEIAAKSPPVPAIERLRQLDDSLK